MTHLSPPPPAATIRNSTEALLAGLNDQQQAAVRHPGGPLLILAGPGSGKTRVICHRIAWLIRCRIVKAEHVLGITFTNKAANEMRERLAHLIGPRGPGALLSTYHSFCARILRADGTHVGIGPGYVVYDATDQLKAARLAIEELNYDTDSITPRHLVWQIGQWKNRMLTPKQQRAHPDGYRMAQLVDCYERYEKILAKADALDFDDLLLQAVSLLRDHDMVREKYTARYRHVLVDEYQDTNHAQYELTRLLGREHRNVCAVGDPDQAIYGWRGADIRNIRLFAEDFPEHTVIQLERNYRSSRNIVSAAAMLIAHNEDRADKTLWTDRSAGAAIRHLSTGTEHDEADTITGIVPHRAGRTEAHRGALPHQRAVAPHRGLPAPGRDPVPHRRQHPLLRTQGDQGRARLPEGDHQPPRRGQPAAHHQLPRPRHRTAHDREGRRRGAGRRTRGHAVRPSRGHRAPVAVDPAQRRLRERQAAGPRPRKDAEVHPPRQNDARRRRRTCPSARPSKAAISRTGYLKTLRDENSTEAEDRIDNLMELVSAADDYQQTASKPTLADFVNRQSLLSEVDEGDGPSDARVWLMTLHAAKGLEFPTVIIAGLEEGLLPHSRNVDTDAGIEEERRLFYVGMTRAMDRLVITTAQRRRRYGGTVSVESRFLDEVGLEHRLPDYDTPDDQIP